MTEKELLTLIKVAKKEGKCHQKNVKLPVLKSYIGGFIQGLEFVEHHIKGEDPTDFIK